MNQYIITYLGGDQPSSPEEGKQYFAEYQESLQFQRSKRVSDLFRNTQKGESAEPV